MPHTDAELIQQIFDNNQAAFRVLYDRYKNDVYRLLLHLAGPHKVHDLYQDTWFRISRYFLKKKPVTNFKGFLIKTAVNIFRDDLRKTKIRNFVLGQEPVHEDFDSDIQHSIAVPQTNAGDTNLDIQMALVQSMESLAPKQRIIFSLFYINGYSLKEISDMQNIALGTVKATLHKVTRKLSQELEIFRNK